MGIFGKMRDRVRDRKDYDGRLNALENQQDYNQEQVDFWAASIERRLRALERKNEEVS